MLKIEKEEVSQIRLIEELLSDLKTSDFNFFIKKTPVDFLNLLKDLLTKKQNLYEKRYSSNRKDVNPSFSYNSFRSIQIIYNLSKKEFEIADSYNKKINNVGPFLKDDASSQIDRLLVYEFCLEQLVRSIKKEELDLIFESGEDANSTASNYSDQFYLQFVSPNGFELFLDVLVKKSYNSLKRSFLKLMKGELGNESGIPFYLNEKSFYSYLTTFSYYKGKIMIGKKTLYDFQKEYSNKNLQSFVNYCKRYLTEIDIDNLSENRILQHFSVFGTAETIEFLKSRLTSLMNEFKKNQEPEYYRKIENSLLNSILSIAQASLYKEEGEEGIDKRSETDFYQFCYNLLLELQTSYYNYDTEFENFIYRNNFEQNQFFTSIKNKKSIVLQYKSTVLYKSSVEKLKELGYNVACRILAPNLTLNQLQSRIVNCEELLKLDVKFFKEELDFLESSLKLNGLTCDNKTLILPILNKMKKSSI